VAAAAAAVVVVVVVVVVAAAAAASVIVLAERKAAVIVFKIQCEDVCLSISAKNSIASGNKKAVKKNGIRCHIIFFSISTLNTWKQPYGCDEIQWIHVCTFRKM
jgi:hypothetical protein